MARGTERDRPRLPWTQQAFRRAVARANASVDADTGGSEPSASSTRRVLAIGNSTASIQNTEVDLTWGTPEISDSDTTITSEEVLFVAGGTFAIDVSARADSGNRSEMIIRTYKDTGSGWVEMTDHIASDYISRDADQDTGGTTLATMLTLSDGDKLKWTVESDADGTAVLMPAGTILRIVGEST